MSLRIVNDAEAELARTSSRLTTPRGRECVLCFVARMIEEFGCDSKLRWAGHWRDACAPRATALEGRLGDKGGFCDCEIFMNAYDPAWPNAYDEEGQPGPLPGCLGATRRGSSQPCANWRPRVRGSR